MKNLVRILALSALALSLGACGKKSNKSSTSATTPTTNQCVWNATVGYYAISGTTTQCTPPTNSGQCVYQNGGYYYAGTNTPCNNTNCTLGQYGYVNQYGQPCTPNGYNQVGGGYGCEIYNNQAQYGYAYYVPVMYGGQLVCMRYDLVQYYTSNQYSYWGQYASGCQWGSGYCGSGYGYGGNCINIGGHSWGANYGLNGNIGLCW